MASSAVTTISEITATGTPMRASRPGGWCGEPDASGGEASSVRSRSSGRPVRSSITAQSMAGARVMRWRHRGWAIRAGREGASACYARAGSDRHVANEGSIDAIAHPGVGAGSPPMSEEGGMTDDASSPTDGTATLRLVGGAGRIEIRTDPDIDELFRSSHEPGTPEVVV